MAVRRIVTNIAAQDLTKAKAFYVDVLGLNEVMDMGWIITFAAEEKGSLQVSVLSEGGSGTPVPDISVEVDDLDGILGRAKKLGFPIEYGPAEEPWGVRRFYVRDPFGKLVNVLSHLK